MIPFFCGTIASGASTNNIANLCMCFLAFSIVSIFLWFNVCRKVVQLKEKVEEFMSKKNQSGFDDITGIYNRDKFYKETQRLVLTSNRGEFSMFRCDINRFKIINELLGRDYGDGILRVLALTIKNLVGDGVGTYGRLENDVFLMCVPTSKYTAKEVYERLTDALKKSEDGFSITVCVGVYVIDNPCLSVGLMSDRASLSLKNIKGKIVDGYAYYDSILHESILKEQKLFYNIDLALQEHQFEIYLQPIYNLKTLKIEYAEALIRWKHPTKGLLPPSEFLPYAEKNGFINTIDIYVWTTVCKYLKGRKDENKRTIPISVNISRASLLSKNLSHTLKSLVMEYEIDPSDLKLEITEDSYMNTSSEVLSVIYDLKEFGFEFFMDDFGSGYSSLGILRDIPFNVIKLDKLFIDGLNFQETSINFLLSVLNMAKVLNIPVIMEGAETKEQVAFLIDNDFDFAQGYYFSRPIIFQEFEKFLDKEEV